MSTELVRAELVLREEGIAYETTEVRLKNMFLAKGLRLEPGLQGICDLPKTICKIVYEYGPLAPCVSIALVGFSKRSVISKSS